MLSLVSIKKRGIRSRLKNSLLLASLCFLPGCGREKPLFDRMDSAETGIHFDNHITESDSLNVLTFEYIYNGGGVGVGDLNNDGLPDVFFSGNQVPSRLYLNKGNMQFEDITGASGLKTPYWSTGVSLVDINQDGWLDIYLCTANPKRGHTSPNQLFVNQGPGKNGVPTFREMAEVAGLADRGYSTQAAWLDYDRDGDLDMYLLTNALEDYDRSLPVGQKKDGSGKSVDRLYRNEGAGSPVPHFTDASREAGITIEGWGLGIGVADVNQDGWPDIYCANDFQSNDLLWINDRHGHFTNRIAACMRHQSSNSMGVDIADINNDGLPDLVNLDMMPDDNPRQKTMFSKPNYERFQLTLAQGYQPQYVRNSLQLNNGPDASGEPSFSEIGFMAGVAATDWSWSALLADFDNDGYRDLLVTNGYKKDITNLDFVNYGGNKNAYLRDDKALEADRKQNAEQMNALLGVKKSNFLFRNRSGDPDRRLTFEDVTERWGLSIPSFSNGAAYADLDNDGDLDLVINNINDAAFVYRNTLNDRPNGKAQPRNHFLRVKLAGPVGNLNGLGATIRIDYGGHQQVAEQSLQRGYKSTVEPILHFGLGDAIVVDSLTIRWPDGRVQTLRHIAADQVLTLSARQAMPVSVRPAARPGPLLREVSSEMGLAYRPQEEDYVDFKVQPLLPHKHSQLGPGLAVGDLNGDGLDDLLIGGSAKQPARMAYQQPNGHFSQVSFLPKTAEDTGILLFDADNDGDNDLYCVSGSSEFGRRSELYKHRFYRNLGRGRFVLDSLALPDIRSSGSCVTACDFDRDGDLDLFVGGRMSPVDYPTSPRSYLIRNNGPNQAGRPQFTDVTKVLAPELARVGMVTASLWTDTDTDGWPDLLLVGEWMPITLFKNNKGRQFTHPSPTSFVQSTGWWNSLVAGDFDNDGDMDYVAGNLGLNSVYQASPAEPVCIYADDYNQDGLMDPVLSRYIQGQEYPVHYRESLFDQMIGMRRMLKSYADYGRMTFRDLFSEETTKKAFVRQATQFASVYIENQGKNEFKLSRLPMSAQVAPLFGMQVADINNDGNLDVLAVGNDYSPETLTGRLDASIGLVLQGNGKGGFQCVPVAKTGFFVNGDAKGLARLTLTNGTSLWIATQNQDSLRVFTGAVTGPVIALQPTDQYAELVFLNGRKRRQEFYFGEGYLSQSSRSLPLPADVIQLVITNSRGNRRAIDMAVSVVRTATR